MISSAIEKSFLIVAADSEVESFQGWLYGRDSGSDENVRSENSISPSTEAIKEGMCLSEKLPPWVSAF